jgi:hypothetical protein
MGDVHECTDETFYLDDTFLFSVNFLLLHWWQDHHLNIC